MILPPQSPLPCFMVNNLTNSSQEQCKFIQDNDCLEDGSIIDYVYLVYCDLGHELRYVSIILIVLLVIILFLALSSVADEFLCPCLLAVAKNLRMSDSLAGVTLLAFGNGCPDIFSSLAAASDDRSELIIGELLGAGIFCTSIVSGIIFIHSDFKLARRPVLRDTTFYLLAVYLIWSYCWTEEITFYGSLAFVLIYLVYLIVALGGQAIHSRLQGDYAIAETQTRNSTEEKEKNENWFQWREESLKRKRKALKEKQLETTSLMSSLNSQNQHNENNCSYITSIHLGSDSFESSPNSKPLPSPIEQKLQSSINSSKQPIIGSSGCINKAFVDYKPQDEILENFDLTSTSLKNSPSTPPLEQVIKLDTSLPSQFTLKHHQDVTYSEFDEFLSHINPIDSQNWRELKFHSKLINLLRAPLVFATILTVPVLDYDRRLNNWCRLLNSLHCITVPMAFTLATHIGTKENFNLFGLPLPILVSIPGLIVGSFVLKTTNAQQPPKYHSAFAYFGFLMSIMWIYLLATEIISLLKTVGIIFSMSDTAIGLGILAWGNSLGDIVANVSLAEAGYPRMAIGASIGAPLLNLLLGFGLSFTINLKPGESSIFEYSPMITLLCSTLAIILISLMVSTLFAPERSKKPFGYILISCYAIYFSLAVCLEYGLIKV